MEKVYILEVVDYPVRSYELAFSTEEKALEFKAKNTDISREIYIHGPEVATVPEFYTPVEYAKERCGPFHHIDMVTLLSED